MRHFYVRVGFTLTVFGCGGGGAPSGSATAASMPLASSSASTAATARVPATAPRAPVTQLAAFGDVTCARHQDGAVRCWGDNQYNVISNEDSSLARPSFRRPQMIANLPPAAEVALGPSYACARLVDGTVRCWGTDDGDLGLGTPLPAGPPPHTETPMPVLGLTGVTALSIFDHVCALLDSKAVTCFGDYDRGVGDPRDAGSRVPVVVPGFAGALQIADGGTLSCARLPSSVKCFRDVSPGLIPKGKVRADPFTITVSNVALIAVADSGGCAITTTGTLSCWGGVPFASMGASSLTVAHAIPGVRDIVAIALNDGLACMITKAGDVLCDAADYGKQHVPTKVVGINAAVSIVVGSSHACALTRDGTVSCWGQNDQGQLGDGALSDRASASPVIW
ncbi:hypothetical protein BH09MYX1_BH09MYX1_49810 [soil metagenome]